MATASHKVKSAQPSRMSEMATSAISGRISDHLYPILFCSGLVAVFLVMLTQGEPMTPANGSLVVVDKTTLMPLDRPVIPGDTVRISWNQEWKSLCSIKVTPRFIGTDQIPKSQQTYTLNPPDKLGFKSSDDAKRYFDFPYIAPGPATYSALLQPNCWIDNFWQREFITPSVSFEVGALTSKQEQKPSIPAPISQHK